MKLLTVITTTYNRAYCLHQVYESLCRQTSNEFIWMVIDDGSTDHTKELVENWIAEKKIEIEYYFKENGGMHTARNLAYEKVHTELNVIIDSDDWMTDDGVELILSFWEEKKREVYAGIVSYDISPEGKIIGTPLPDGIESATYTELVDKYHVKGDKKLIYRSELTRKYPYPEFEGEKFFPASYKFRLIDLDHRLLLMRKPTCVVNYGEDSMSVASNKMKQYITCCKSFAFSRNEMIRISKSPRFILKEMIHYIAESKIAENPIIRGSSRPFVAILCYPLGMAYYYYLLRRTGRASYD